VRGDWREWVARAVGSDATVVRARRLHGGITSLVHAVDVEDAHGLRHRLVLRRYPDAPSPQDDPVDLVNIEVRSLERLAAADVVGTPRLVAADPEGVDVGVPATLSTRLLGRPVLDPEDPMRWAEELAAAVVDHLDAMRVIDAAALPAYESWHPLDADDAAEPPGWVQDKDTWREAMGTVATAIPPSASSVQAIHRDLNPGNVLWHRDRVVGIVDWVHLCAGPIEEDLGRARVNIALLTGLAPADSFLEALEGAGVSYDRTWDLAVLADMAPYLTGIHAAANKLGATLTEDVVHERAEAIVRAYG
jgi:aminoglycoside phosphotransferase (APT) family kinase protein